MPETQPASNENSVPSGPPLLVAPDGTRYYGGLTDLRVVTPDGRQTMWTLPDIATGTEPVHLVRTADGRLYLFNQPGRVLRITPTPTAAEPFTVEATFSRNIPATEDPTRIWLDPAGRIIIAHGKQLAILFPSGIIPQAIRLKMLDTEDVEEGP